MYVDGKQIFTQLSIIKKSFRQVVPASPLAAKERLHQIPVKKNTDKPRQMLEVK